MFYKRIFFIVSFILFSQFSFSQNDFSSPKEFDARLLTNFVKAVKVSYSENFVNFGFDINEQLWFIDLKNDDVKKTQEKEKRFFYKNARIFTFN